MLKFVHNILLNDNNNNDNNNNLDLTREQKNTMKVTVIPTVICAL